MEEHRNAKRTMPIFVKLVILVVFLAPAAVFCVWCFFVFVEKQNLTHSLPGLSRFIFGRAVSPPLARLLSVQPQALRLAHAFQGTLYPDPGALELVRRGLGRLFPWLFLLLAFAHRGDALSEAN